MFPKAIGCGELPVTKWWFASKAILNVKPNSLYLPGLPGYNPKAAAAGTGRSLNGCLFSKRSCTSELNPLYLSGLSGSDSKSNRQQ
jgi:hypothetical protein